MDERNQSERVLQTFLDLVRIDSPSGEESACAGYCAEALEQAGCEVMFDDSETVTGSDTGNLVATLPGTAATTLILSAHMDCVEPCRGVEPVLRDGRVFSAGDTVLGADDKVGLAAAIETVRRLSASPQDHATVRCVFTVKEEVGLTGAKALCADHVAGDLCLVLDADGAPGGIVVAAPTHYTFVARFVGRSAHAGVEPEKGVSAIAMAADAIGRMETGRLDERTTANIGAIRGGSATNVVPAEVHVTGECRSLDDGRVEEVRARMHEAMQAAAAAAGGTVEVEWTREYGAFSMTEEDGSVALVTGACEAVGLTSRVFSTGGGSDANVIAALGTPTLAVSCGMSSVHGVDESVAMADLEALTALCVRVAHAMAEEG